MTGDQIKQAWVLVKNVERGILTKREALERCENEPMKAAVESCLSDFEMDE